MPASRVAPAYKLVGKDYPTPDMMAKVTGKAKYAEDFRAEGMLFCRLVLSPMPHGRIKRLDASDALAMPGVKAIFTADDIPPQCRQLQRQRHSDQGQQVGRARAYQRAGLPREVRFWQWAVDELTCAEAIEKIRIDLEPLPLSSTRWRACAPAAPIRTRMAMCGCGTRIPSASNGHPRVKWTEKDFADYDQGKLPMGHAPDEWKYGDLDKGFKEAALILDETFVTPDVSHQCLEPRTSMAYWQNGKLYMHTGTQSTAQTRSRYRALDEHESGRRRVYQRIHRRRIWQQDYGQHHDDHSRDAFEEAERPCNDAHQPRRRAIYRACAAQR